MVYFLVKILARDYKVFNSKHCITGAVYMVYDISTNVMNEMTTNNTRRQMKFIRLVMKISPWRIVFSSVSY